MGGIRRARLGRRGVAAALAPAAVACLLSAAAFAATAERPASELTRYVADLRAAAKQSERARASASALAGRQCAGFAPAAAELAGAAEAARKAFEAYRTASTRYGTQEEIALIAALAVDLREARGHLARAAGESGVPSEAEQRAAAREVGLFQTFVALKLERRLGVEGLADVLTSTSFRDVKAKVASELQRRVRERAERELRRIVGFRIRLGVPLKQQLRDFMEAELAGMLSKLSVSAGPAGILVSLVGSRLVALVGAKLQEALRHKGSLVQRTSRTVSGFGAQQAALRALPKDAPLDRVRALAHDAQRALAATAFLEGDLRRAGRADLLAQVADARRKLEATMAVARLRFLLDSELVGEDFRIATAFSAGVRSDAQRLAKKVGCPLAGTGAPGSGSERGVVPTAKSCPPSFTMESIQSLPPYAKTGEFRATFSRIEKHATYGSKCLYLTDGGNEAFVVFLDYNPPNVPGVLASGDCGRSWPDSPPFYRSRKRFLTVSGGERGMFTRAAGGNEAILKQALALAEAEGVGHACPK
jgi:hypothetical protein